MEPFPLFPFRQKVFRQKVLPTFHAKFGFGLDVGATVEGILCTPYKVEVKFLSPAISIAYQCKVHVLFEPPCPALAALISETWWFGFSRPWLVFGAWRGPPISF
jgi:hypothetical protein